MTEKITIIVEHMEEYLYEWCLHEYLQMKEYLKGSNAELVITNGQSMFDYEGDKKADNESNLGILVKEFENAGQGKCRIERKSVIELVEGLKLVEPVCMLDMRGEKELSPSENWSTLIFGGILGDHPPRDRPAPVRKYFPTLRHLGDLQLATDTAVLISKLILVNKLPLSKIPMIREPTIKGENKNGEKTTVQMEGFSYVSKELDIENGCIVEGVGEKVKKQVYMSEGVKRLLIEEDLSAESIM